MQKRKKKSPIETVTMRDVAKLAGVSQSTVSRVLSDTSSPIPIGEETIQRVMAAVEQLNYHPNLTARSLRMQQTFMIAIMIADISNAFYHSIVRTVQDIARKHNYDVLIANTDQIYDNERHFCQALMRRPVDGVIMVPYHLTSTEIDQLIDRTGAAVVALAFHLHNPRVDTVFGDDGRATYEAINWLIDEKRHRKIGFIGVSDTYPPGIRRHEAFLKAMAEHTLSIPPGYVQEGDFSIESGQAAIGRLLALDDPPTAVFVCNDLMAIGAINGALEMNVRVPEDISIIGFDNIPESTVIRPKLTTIAQYPVEMGQQLAHFLFERIEGIDVGPSRRFEIPCRLIERDSTRTIQF
jgi:DNA-binding LacI/PurR family transcriptional regulator